MSNKSECCNANISGSFGDGVLIGTCDECHKAVCRMNSKTGKSEWLDGDNPWTKKELRPMEECRKNER